MSRTSIESLHHVVVCPLLDQSARDIRLRNRRGVSIGTGKSGEKFNRSLSPVTSASARAASASSRKGRSKGSRQYGTSDGPDTRLSEMRCGVMPCSRQRLSKKSQAKLLKSKVMLAGRRRNQNTGFPLSPSSPTGVNDHQLAFFPSFRATAAQGREAVPPRRIHPPGVPYTREVHATEAWIPD